MGRFDGYVLRPARVSPANASTTGEAFTGVPRDVRPVPTAYDMDGVAPAFVDARADQYRAAVLSAPSGEAEYLVWAANSAQVAWIEDASWWVDAGKGVFATGSLQVTDSTPPSLPQGVPQPSDYGTFSDGTDKVVVTDNGGRSLAQILTLVVARGDVDTYDDAGWVDPDNTGSGRKGSNPYLVLSIAAADQNASTGVVTLTTAQLTSLAGGLSLGRGDSIVEVRYTLKASRYWWTRNDAYQTRFGWNSRDNRWSPFKGGSPTKLGEMAHGATFTLTPKPTGLAIGSYLPGTTADAHATLRMGAVPDATSAPVAASGVHTGVRVVADADLTGGYSFAKDPNVAGVVSKTGGVLEFNPSYLDLHSGKTLWYVPSEFQADSDGLVGALADNLVIAPVPREGERPHLRIGSRTHLSVTSYATDADMAAATTPTAGQVFVSRSTGKLRLSQSDIDKADVSKSGFDKHYLGASIYYDGVSLNSVGQPLKAPKALVSNGGKLYVPDATDLPTEFAASDVGRGLGVSGILDVADGTGATPAQAGTAASVRPGGDSVGGSTTGRVRQVGDGVGDVVLFSRKGAVTEVKVVDRTADLPTNTFEVPRGTGYVARAKEANGSQVQLSSGDLSTFGSDTIYFLQATLLPATHTTQARVLSKVRHSFTFAGTEKLYFNIDGTAYTWTAPAGTKTTDEVVASLNTTITGTGQAINHHGSVALEAGTPASGTVEIGWGAANVKDLSGASALGLLPGWRVKGGVDNWLADSGLAFGMQRSPANLNRSNSTPDQQDTAQVSDIVIAPEVAAQPFQFLQKPPLLDVAGYGDGVFFKLRKLAKQGSSITESKDTFLTHYGQVLYKFEADRFDWVASGTSQGAVKQPTRDLFLGKSNVDPNSLRPQLGGKFDLSEGGGALTAQTQDTDYLLPQSGQVGIVRAVETFGAKVSSGGLGTFTKAGTTFTDTGASFTTKAQVGYRLRVLSGDSAGSYEVTGVTNDTTLEVSPAFPVSSTQATGWILHKGFTQDVYDPGVVADHSFKAFNHMPSEPFQVRLLSSLGATPADSAAQSASRLKGDLEGAIRVGRALNLRFELVLKTSATEASLTPLAQTLLGTIANGSLTVPATGTRLSGGHFAVRVGTATHTPVGVVQFSADPVGVEYLTAANGSDPAGRLKFNSSLLSDSANQEAWYVETFLPSSALATGAAEYDPESGEFNLSDGDMTAQSGKTCYLVESLVINTDVTVSPISGSFSLARPVKTGQVVEAEYYLADKSGKRTGSSTTEFLPVVKTEAATRESETIYRFNAPLDTVVTSATAVVHAGAIEQSFGVVEHQVDYPDGATGKGRVTFLKSVVSHVPVEVTFSVLEAQGGEVTYQASGSPLYRPPFFIPAKQSHFGVRGDRTSDLSAGQLLRLGGKCFYIRSTQYFAAEDVTKVNIFPPTVAEAGSRSPGAPTLQWVTAKPTTTSVDVDGIPTATAGKAGFLQTISTQTFPFERAEKGQKNILFKGDLTAFAVPGHLLEVGGYPFIIEQVELGADGGWTTITVADPFPVKFDVADTPTVKLSYRPIYPPGSTAFLGAGPMEADSSHELVLWEDGKPGRTLLEGVEYRINKATGRIRFLSPNQTALAGNQRLVLGFTRQKILKPKWSNRKPLFPLYRAEFLHNAIPDADNGYLGAELRASYSYYNPDSYYCRVAPFKSYLSDVVADAQAETPSNGVVVETISPLNWKQGREGPDSTSRTLQDKDRSARAMLGFYHEVVTALEQVQEAIDGEFVGDRDGRFRFDVRTGSEWTPPGFEDDVTGYLNPRDVWAELFLSKSSGGIRATQEDPVVHPTGASLDGSGNLTGQFPSAEALDTLIREQSALIANDVDDVVLTGTKEVKTGFNWPNPTLTAKGLRQRTGAPHVLSRLFPTEVDVFSTTFPGVGADLTANLLGSFTWGINVAGKLLSTAGKPVAQLANAAQGQLSGVADATLSTRRARARIWGYFPDGLPAGAFTGSSAITKPCLVATPAMLSQFVIDPATKYPDEARLISQGGETADLSAGDPSLHVPGFKAGDQLGWGRPDGTFLEAYSTSSALGVLTGLFVDEVLHGCVLTFKDHVGIAITSSADVLVGSGSGQGVPAHEFGIQQGDTIRAVAPSGQPLPTGTTAAEFAATMLDFFRTGQDLEVRSDGSVVDLSMPSVLDGFPFGVAESLGQKPLKPLEAIEGTATLLSNELEPLRIPALTGSGRNDAGDFSLPYLSAGKTERERISQATVRLGKPITAQDSGNSYVYPDEVVGNDGELKNSHSVWYDPVGPNIYYKEPATLLSERDATPVANGSGAKGIGDARRYDLLLVESGTAFSAGARGILSIGEVVTQPSSASTFGSLVEPPRFVTPTTAPSGGANTTGSPVRYVFNNAICWTQLLGDYPADPQATPQPGVKLIEDWGLTTTIIDFSDIDMALNNGDAAGAGNLNDLWSANNMDARYYNRIIIKLIARTDPNITNAPGGGAVPTAGQVVLTIEIQGDNVQATDHLGNSILVPNCNTIQYGVDPAAPPTIVEHRQIRINKIGIIDFQSPNESNWFLPHSITNPGPVQVKQSLYGYEFTVDIDTYHEAGNGAFPNDKGQSNTAWIGADRLSFNEVWDLRFVKERGYQHPLGHLTLEGKLVVDEVTLPGNYPSIVNQGVNGDTAGTPNPFTFLARSSSVGAHDDTAGGTWIARADANNPEKGTIKVMAYEGYNNTSITGTGATFSVVPSNDDFEAGGDILSGTGKAASRDNGAITNAADLDDRVTGISVTTGDVDNVVAGDVLVIDASTDGTHVGTTKAGTYLVRHAIKATGANPYKEVAPATTAGAGAGWMKAKFPTVVSFVAGTNLLTISDLAGFTGAPQVGGVESGFQAPGGSRRIYVVIKSSDLTSSTMSVWSKALISAEYSNINTAGDDPVFTLTDYRDANNAVMTASEFAALVKNGQKVSGFHYVETHVEAPGLPDNSVVGHDSTTDNSVKGFRYVSFHPVDGLTGTGTVNYSGNAADPIGATTGKVMAAAGTGGTVTVTPHTPATNTGFVSNSKAAVYPNVPHYIFMGDVSDAQWRTLNSPPGGAGAGAGTVMCLLPGTGLKLSHAGTGAAGFYAQAGIFLEPSFPRQVVDLSSGSEHLVDASHSVAATDIGMRSFEDLLAPGAAAAPNTAEAIKFHVRRIRRFHDVLSDIDTHLKPLRYAYEVRRGRVTAFSTTVKQHGLLTASAFVMNWSTGTPAPHQPDVWNDGGTYTGTNLGAFNDSDVGINAGDTLRLLDDEGRVVSKARVVEVVSDSQLRLEAGLSTPAVGQRFEVYLSRAPVPQEQSWEQALELITDQVVLRTDANYTNGKGGYVPEIQVGQAWAEVANRLYDDLNVDGTGSNTYVAKGVERGDIVLVDPSGTIPGTNGEVGMFPVGDKGITGRTGHAGGTPDPLDDNRGFYRVSNVNATYLEVDGSTALAGTPTTDVLFPSDASLRASRGFTLLPAVTASTLNHSNHVNPAPPNNREGQADLRPTKAKDGGNNSYENYADPNDAAYSVRPFGYRVIRPTKLVNKEVVDLVLTMRERTLSLIQMLGAALRGEKSGSYFVFQRDKHAADLGSFTNAYDGKGVWHNSLITAITGHRDVTPYLNTSTVLSLLDRQFWILDRSLDRLTAVDAFTSRLHTGGDPAYPNAGGPYTAFDTSGVRPVIPGLLELALGSRDELRELRYAWLAFRAHQTRGTLAEIDREATRSADRKKNEKRLLRLKDTAGRV